MTDDTDALAALDTRAAFLLSQLGAYTAQQFAERLAPLGIRPVQFGVLTRLRNADTGVELSQQQLSEALGIHRNVMVSLIDSLEERGLVQRGAHPSDRRAYAIRLTDAAHAVLGEATAAADALEEQLTVGLSESEREVLVALLRRITVEQGIAAGVHPGLAG
ncbi:MarR family winged helix-turn-helix transcriptional regulator [Leifsonia poae]|uniref:MarR family transcriptional regulator n=1 Tax=Leifsonia poae TaxID=110933 RepID=A0A9W6LZ41_9MICO|nr:MarR family transcriptional regulator [Leifsonia poae]GLJ75466.1 MarR family transcriptional regulator [Leifsonia poae]